LEVVILPGGTEEPRKVVEAELEILLEWVSVTFGERLHPCFLQELLKRNPHTIYDRLPRHWAMFLEETKLEVIMSCGEMS